VGRLVVGVVSWGNGWSETKRLGYLVGGA